MDIVFLSIFHYSYIAFNKAKTISILIIKINYKNTNILKIKITIKELIKDITKEVI